MLTVAVAAALVSIFFWNTATVVETPLHGKADLYVPPIPIKMAPAERRAVIATAAPGRGKTATWSPISFAYE